MGTRLNGRQLIKLQCSTTGLMIGADRYDICQKFCYLIQPMRLMVESYARQFFLRFCK